jgi:hypothetical protein
MSFDSMPVDESANTDGEFAGYEDVHDRVDEEGGIEDGD